MPFRETLRVAWRSIRANRMRSFLTMLGIIIGVASVIATSAVGQAATFKVTQQVESLGSNILTVFPGSASSGGISRGQGSATTLTLADANAIAKQDPDVAAVAPTANAGGQVVFGSNNTQTAIQGTTANFLKIKPASFAEGRFFQQQEVDRSANVAVLGSTVAQELFSGTGVDPLGQTIDINQIPFTVIGVLDPLGSNGVQNLDNQIAIPITTLQHEFTGSNRVTTINISASSSAVMNQVQQEVESTLRVQHQLRPGTADDFQILNQATILSALGTITGILTAVLAGIAAISLLVGGIGIMNIMLVSVTERTREIGIRKAIGAKRSAILGQFLVESLVLSLSGAIVGVILGGGASEIVGALMKAGNLITVGSIVIAVLFSLAIGLIFGVYPARKAANLKPIDALRYE